SFSLDLTNATDVVTDAGSGELIVSIGGGAPAHADSLVRVDPETGEVTGEQQIGPNPTQLVLSADGSVLYVVVANGPGSIVKQLHTADLTLIRQFTVDDAGALPVLQLDISPVDSDIVAISHDQAGALARGVSIYEDGVRRATTYAVADAPGGLSWGSASRVYFSHGTVTDRLDVAPSGVTFASNIGGMPTSGSTSFFNGELFFDTSSVSYNG
ncbi:unnamed protein product, partial [Phaeothamnion confervicola]